jgi:hypothetical protein
MEVMDKVLEIKANKKEKREGQPFSTNSKKHTFMWWLISNNEGVVI